MRKLGKTKLFALYMPEDMLTLLRREARRRSVELDTDISASELIRCCVADKLQPATSDSTARKETPDSELELCRAATAHRNLANAATV